MANKPESWQMTRSRSIHRLCPYDAAYIFGLRMEFVLLFGGAVAWPLAAGVAAQVFTVGYLPSAAGPVERRKHPSPTCAGWAWRLWRRHPAPQC
jgi:hypothetical protein